MQEMKINVPHVAKLANLTLTNNEEKKFEEQLSEVLDYVKKLDEVDTTGIESTSQVTGLENVMREDIADSSLPQVAALRNAKTVQNGFFQVKGILDSE